MSTRKTVRLLPSCLLAGISLFALPAYAVTFGSVVNVSHSRGDSDTASTAVNGSNVHVVWSEDATVFYARSIDGGSSFGAATQLFSVSGAATGYGSAPAVAVSGLNVYVARSQRTKPNKPSLVYFRRSTNNGTSFASQIQVSTGVGPAVFEAMAVSGSNVYIAWTEFVGGSWDVLIARSTNGGASFLAPVNLSPAPTNAANNDLVLLADGGNVHVAWTEENTSGRYEILFRSSADNGASFGGVINVSNTPGTNSVFPSLAVTGSNVYVAYNDTNVFVAQSINGGISFGVPTDVSLVPASFPCHISANGSDVQVIWSGPGPNAADLFYSHSNTGGIAYSAPVSVTNGTTDSLGVLASNGTNVYLSWSDGSEIYMAHSADGGNIFGATVNVSGSTGVSDNVVTVATPSGIHHVWIDHTPGNPDTFYRHGTP